MLLSVLSLIFVNRSSHSCKQNNNNVTFYLLYITLSALLSSAARLYQGDDSLLVLHILFAHHGVGLASTGLAVGEDADVVALEGVQQHLLADVFVHSHLRGVVDILGLRTEIDNQTLLNIPH